MNLVAVDGGGTGCRAAVADLAGSVLGRGESGPANVLTDLEGTRLHILEAVERAFDQAGLEPALSACKAVLALAGVNVGTAGEALRQQLPFEESIVEWDATAAVRGALGGHDGAVAIIGTGSIFGAKTGSAISIVGGWGFLLGDQASGARLGRALLEDTLLAHDRIIPGSPLTEAVLARFGGDPGEIVVFGQRARPGDIGAFAPDIFAHAAEGDAVAGRIIANAVGWIEASLAAVMPEGCDRLCLIGGLGQPYAPYLGEGLRALLHPPQGNALDGAIAMAVEKFGRG
ncbi:BadF/BadG/BcrA/BcrD ATPase family protein [Chelativorans sp. AA-79]|uniref:BadF/BadG/BcrA/BcrD ATPase family protein n=1 Tax=Chelativorans sp. AA-79 TaxID=3028735 RepID=UPI0023F719EA|nr:BadF/BadG/BcrA/BcrD ATPase family protein [Chelativorans sp. AA-79]WEX10392.1 BadF/BadG/BcrA/BcrD ATPase family protein [Chelativorans sp. AA-79]